MGNKRLGGGCGSCVMLKKTFVWNISQINRLIVREKLSCSQEKMGQGSPLEKLHGKIAQ